MPKVTVSSSIRAPREAVFGLAADMESFPEFMPDVVELKVEERGEGWTVTRWVTKLQGKLFKWREKDEFDPPARISYKQIDGDLKKFEGDWVFEEAGGETRVTLTVDFEFGIPMIGALLNPVAKLKIRENSEKMLDGIKKKAER